MTHRYIGYNTPYQEVVYFSPQNIERISNEASAQCQPHGITAYFTPEVVRSLLEKNYYDYKPPQTDIYSRHQIVPFTLQDKPSRVAEITKNMLVQTALTQHQEAKNNAALDIGITKYTDQLRACPSPRIKQNSYNRTEGISGRY